MSSVKRINNGKVTIEVGRPNVVARGNYRGQTVTIIQIVQNLDVFSICARFRDGTQVWLSPYDF